MIFASAIEQLSEITQQPRAVFEEFLQDLLEESQLLPALAQRARALPEFAEAKLEDWPDLSFYRCLLYLMTRWLRPQRVIETGVLHGFGSSFILQALAHNRQGQLISVDIPPPDERILSQGNHPLPKGQLPGWVVPDHLRGNWQLHLEPARQILPKLFAVNDCQLFVHDSDHSYVHMMLEMALAHSYLPPGGWMIVDNIESNSSFSDFARGSGEHHGVLASRFPPLGDWRHGLLLKCP